MALTPVTNGARHPVDLEGGRVLAPGETGEADLTQPHNIALVDSGLLVASEAQPPVSSLKKDELVALAESRGLDPGDKTKDELLALLEGGEENA